MINVIRDFQKPTHSLSNGSASSGNSMRVSLKHGQLLEDRFPLDSKLFADLIFALHYSQIILEI